MKFLKSVFLILLLFFSIKTVSAKTEILHQGTGNYELTLYSDSTLSDVEKVLGSPKLTTDSAFGGSAYSFYTDDQYSNYLYIETLSDGRIASFATFLENYETPIYSYGTSYPYYMSYVLSGYLLNQDGKVRGGVYYNRYLDDVSTSTLRNTFSTNFSSDPRYKLGMSKQAVVMFNALQQANGKTGSLTFDETVYNLAVSYEENGDDLRSTLNETKEKWAFGLQENIRVEDNTYYLMNPLMLARYGLSSTVKDNYPIAIFYYDETQSMLWSFSISKSLQEEIQSGKFALRLLDEDEILIEQNILYLTESLKGDFTDKEIIAKINQFIQDGNLYQRNINDQNYYGVLVDHGGVCAGYSDAMRLLTSTQGINCTIISSRTQNHAFNLCYADNAWSYYDTQKRLRPSINDATAYSQIDSIPFKSLTYMKDFGYIFDEFANDGKSLLETFPEGKTAEDPSKMYIYYDDTYMYYVKNNYEKVNKNYEWHSYIIRENRTTGVEKNLAEVIYYNRSNAGLVKEKDTLYYIDPNYNLYSIDTNGNNKKKLVSSTSEKQISSVFTREGDLYYGVLNTKTKEAEIIKYKDLTTWSELKTYTLDHSKYAYDLAYLESDENVVIIKAIGLENKLPSGEIYLPDTINEKPVIGIGTSAFETGTFKGEITLPKYLKYIGKSAFSGNQEITKIHFNEQLISIGQNAFYKMSGLTGHIVIPDQVKIIGDASFAYTTGIEEVTLSSKIKMLPRSVFENATNLKKITLGNNIVAIGSDAFSNCVNLQKITIPSTTTHIYSNAFKNTNNLKQIVIESKEMEAMLFKDTDAEIYLHGNSKTGVYARTHAIDYIDLDSISGTITLDQSSINVDYGTAPIVLTYQVTPSIYEDDTYTWASENQAVATVDQNGKVTFVGVGNTTIWLKSERGLMASIPVTVNRVNITDFYLSQSIVWLSPKETIQISSIILPETLAEGQTITWMTNHSEVATVNQSGLITANGIGDATITARLSNGDEKTIAVSVKSSYVQRTVRSWPNPMGSIQIIGHYFGKNNLGETVYANNLTSSKESVAYPKGNYLYASSGGFTKITATTETGDLEHLVYVNGPVILSTGKRQFAGDLNNNSIFDLEDILMIKERIGSTKKDDILLSDIDGDNVITEKDVQTLAEIYLNQSLEIDASYPAIAINGPTGTFTTVKDDISSIGTQLSIKVLEETIYEELPVIWSSNNEEVASVDQNGYVTYHSAGEVTITARLDQNSFATQEFILTDIPVKFSKSIYTMKEKESITPDIIQPTVTSGVIASYHSNDEDIATYQNGVLTAVKEGSTTITYRYKDQEAVATVIVTPLDSTIENRPIESISFIEKELSLKVDEVYRLIPEFNPYDTTMDTTVTYESTNKSVAEVTQEGKIIAKSAGTALIRATTVNGKTAEITVKVKIETKPIESITVTPSNVVLKIGESKTLTTTITPSDTTEDKTITYSSNDMSVASVTKDGTITAVGSGKTTILATTSTGISKEVNITVLKDGESYLLGDMNYSGKIELADFILGLRYYLGTYNNGKGMMDVYDMNKNNKKELGDAILILREYLY